MDSSLTELCRFFAGLSRRGEPLVVATIVRTEGSTYRKAGARILISQRGVTSGLLSGGCLEADLCERAMRVLLSGRPERVLFDSRNSDDPIWGIGLGCEGANHIWLQAAGVENSYAPLPYLSQCLTEQHIGTVATIIGGAALPAELGRHGYADVLDGDQLTAQLSACQATKPEIQNLRYLDRTLEVFVAPTTLPPTLLLCGGGPDAVPVAQFADLLGWRTTVFDHRPGIASPANFMHSATVVLGRPDELTERLQPSKFDAAVIMSHNLAYDVTYLRRLAIDPPRYIGLLGPASRRTRIFDEVGSAVHQIADRIRGPVGLDIGANSPASIALAIVAQIHAVLAGKHDAAFASALPDYPSRART